MTFRELIASRSLKGETFDQWLNRLYREIREDERTLRASGQEQSQHDRDLHSRMEED